MILPLTNACMCIAREMRMWQVDLDSPVCYSRSHSSQDTEQTDGWIRKMYCAHTMGYYSVTSK